MFPHPPSGTPDDGVSLAPSPSPSPPSSPSPSKSVVTWTPSTPTAASFPLPPYRSSLPMMANVPHLSGEATFAGTRLGLQTRIEGAYGSSSSESSAGESDSDALTTPDEAEVQDYICRRSREPRATSRSVANTDAFALALPFPPRLAPRKSTPNIFPTFRDWLPNLFPAAGKLGVDDADTDAGLTRLALDKRPGVVGEQFPVRVRPLNDRGAQVVADVEVDGGGHFATSPFTPFASADDTFTFFLSKALLITSEETYTPVTSTLLLNSEIYTPTEPTHLPTEPAQNRPGTPSSDHNPISSAPPPQNLVPSSLRPLAAPFVPARAAIRVATHGVVDDYPLSEADTAHLASLHDGRTPTLQQIAPSDILAASSGALPIVNTGNEGPMVLQFGDWQCGACRFFNWRRRKICMRCFPLANDIGKQPTQPSHLNTPGSDMHPSRNQERLNSGLPHTVLYQSYPTSLSALDHYFRPAI